MDQPQPKPEEKTTEISELMKLIQAQNKALESMTARLEALEKKPEPPKPTPAPTVVPNTVPPEPPKPARTYASILADIKSNKEDKK